MNSVDGYHHTYVSGLCTSTLFVLINYDREVKIMIDNAGCLEDLKVPPANHLEPLHGDREGQYSIRINDQYRICFSVEGKNDFQAVEIVDYH